MIEVPLGMMAWMGVIALQALLLKVIIPTRSRQKSHAEFELSLEEKRTLEAISEETEYCNDDDDLLNQVYGTTTSGQEEFQDDEGEETPLQSPSVPAFGCNGRSLEEEQIQQLLNQTGSELVVGSPQDCLSMSFFERLAKEQIQQPYLESGDETPLEEEAVRPMDAAH